MLHALLSLLLLLAVMSAFIVGIRAIVHRVRVRITWALVLAVHNARKLYWNIKERRYPTPGNRERAAKVRLHWAVKTINDYLDCVKATEGIKICRRCGFPIPYSSVICPNCSADARERIDEVLERLGIAAKGR